MGLLEQIMTPNFKIFLIAITLLMAAILLPGCSQLNALAVDEGENAFACVKGNTGIPYLGGSGVMVDAGKTDTTNWTADNWRDLAEICD
jgi:hypothetical protein